MGVADHLRSLGEDGLAALLRERPVLLEHCATLSELAYFLEAPYAVNEALCHTNAFEHAAAEVIAALGPVRPAEMAVALGLEGDAPEVDEAITRLERLLLAERLPDDLIAPARGVTDHMGHPLDLGRPLTAMISQFDAGAVRRAAQLLGLPKTGNKAALTAAVSGALSDPDTVRRALAGGPRGTEELVDRLLGAVMVDVGYGRPPPTVAWLLEHLMLVRAYPYGGPAELVREVALARRGPVLRVVAHSPPTLTGRAVRDFDASASHRSAAVVPLLASVVDVLGAEPARAIQSGELGVRDLKRLAKAADTDEATAGRLLEMARSAGLVGTSVTVVSPEPRRGTRWQAAPAPVVEWLPTTRYDAWIELEPGRRWAELAAAWLDTRAWPSRAGARGESGKISPAFSPHGDAADAPRLRRVLLGLLAGLGAGQAGDVTELACALAWHQFRCRAWGITDSVTVTEGVLAEAELLGIVAGGALSTLGRALLEDGEAAALTAGRMLPAPVREILVQADLTAIATGPLERDVAEELSSMAEVESRGVATIWRFSESSIRRALDHGATPDRMLGFLDEHASKGIPQPLRYVINDAARRHGRLRVAAAACVVTSDDPALLAEVRAARKTAKLKLRELAPTVLASPLPSDSVLLTLRTAGFLPAEERADGHISLVRPERRRASAQGGQVPRARPAVDVVPLARRLLKERPVKAGPADGRAAFAAFADLLGGDPYDEDDSDEAAWWITEADDITQPAYRSPHELLAKAAGTGAEVALISSEGRNGTEVVGTVAMLTEATVVIRNTNGRQKAIALNSILSIWEEP